MSEKYVIVRDSYNRMRAEITDSFAVGVKLLAEDHRRRVENQVHAYVVADLRTEVGPWRIRDIRIVWNEKKQKFLVRYKQWKTGKMRDGKEEYLDVAGPLDAETRAKVGEIILSVFFQIKEEAAKGTLGRRRDRGMSTVGDNPEVAAQLESLKDAMAEDEANRAEDLAMLETQESQTIDGGQAE